MCVWNTTGSFDSFCMVSILSPRTPFFVSPTYRRRIELVQDLAFPSSCARLKLTPDGQHLIGTGVHPPQMRVFDLTQLSLKFDRHYQAEAVDFQILGDDYAKLAILGSDRSVSLHAKYGLHHQLRMPKQGRDMAYLPFLGDLLVVGSASEIYRLSLTEGTFLTPILTHSPGINVCGWAPTHGLFATGGEDGVLECFDLRAPRSISCLDVGTALKRPAAHGVEVTALRFNDTGLQLAVGTSDGHVGVFDLRAPRPISSYDQGYGAPIVDIKMTNRRRSSSSSSSVGAHLLTTDRHICKIWDVQSGKLFTSMQPSGTNNEPPGHINDCCYHPDTGLVMLACDDTLVHSFFAPSLGPAPAWCTFLEAMTE